MSAPSDALTIAQFAQKLRELRIDCGVPSYQTIASLTRRHKESISVGSINTLLKGERLTRPEIVRAFVRGVLQHRDDGERPEHTRVVTHWFDMWKKMRNASGSQPTERVPPTVSERSPESPEQPPERLIDSYGAEHREAARSRQSARAQLIPPQVQIFQQLLNDALQATDELGRRWGDAKYGCYTFFDYDGEPIYIGQTNEQLRTRVRRHLSNQRTDAVAMRILDVQEVAEMELWPLWEFQETKQNFELRRLAQRKLDAVEYTIYIKALARNRFGVLLNERIPPTTDPVALPPSQRFHLVNDELRRERGSMPVRIARRAENLARLTSIAMDRGQVSEGFRRVIAVQAARLTQLAASQYALAIGVSDLPVHVEGLAFLARNPLPSIERT